MTPCHNATMATSNKERQAKLVRHREQQGLKQYRNIWGFPEDEAAVKEFNKTRLELRKIEKSKLRERK